MKILYSIFALSGSTIAEPRMNPLANGPPFGGSSCTEENPSLHILSQEFYDSIGMEEITSSPKMGSYLCCPAEFNFMEDFKQCH